MKINVLIGSILVFHSVLSASFSFDELEKKMSDEEKRLSGIEKLTNENRACIEKWLQSKKELYHVAVPTVSDVADITWAYETRRCSKRAKKHAHPCFERALCAILNNSAKTLPDWLEKQKRLGYAHFYLYNTLSEDAYLEVLIPYIESGQVDLIQWPQKVESAHDKKQVYKDCTLRAKTKHLVCVYGNSTS